MTLILSSTSCSSKGKNMLGMSRSVALLELPDVEL